MVRRHIGAGYGVACHHLVVREWTTSLSVTVCSVMLNGLDPTVVPGSGVAIARVGWL